MLTQTIKWRLAFAVLSFLEKEVKRDSHSFSEILKVSSIKLESSFSSNEAVDYSLSKHMANARTQ